MDAYYTQEIIVAALISCPFLLKAVLFTEGFGNKLLWAVTGMVLNMVLVAWSCGIIPSLEAAFGWSIATVACLIIYRKPQGPKNV